MNFETVLDAAEHHLAVTTDLIDGYAIRHLAEFDSEFLTITNVLKAHGTLTYGNVHPTLILSSTQLLRELISKVHPRNHPLGWDGPFRRGYKMMGAPWWPSMIPEMDDGWVVLLNEDHPMNPKLNGCYKVGAKS